MRIRRATASLSDTICGHLLDLRAIQTLRLTPAFKTPGLVEDIVHHRIGGDDGEVLAIQGDADL